MNSVSPDGSRLAFTALSDEPATAGNEAIFVREDGGASVIEASRKQGGAADNLGAKLETASPDGSHVFFLATYGLTPTSSSGPLENCSYRSVSFLANQACDLYDYDVDAETLTDLSVTTAPANTNGAVVRSVLGVSEGGESVYFSARGQLLPDEGRTYAQNIAGDGSANVYLARDGQLAYVATIESGEGSLERSQVTPDGDHLLFESRADVTGYQSGGASEVYLYSAEDETTICISCRPDGQPSVGKLDFPLITPSSVASVAGRRHEISDDGRRIFFTMTDVLAPGAVSGNVNVYEWEEGQVFLLTTGDSTTKLYGATASGDDVFIRSAKRLTGWDKDFALDLYDFRVGGGFPDPPPPPVPCDPAADQCQGTPASQPMAPSPASAAFSGPGNPPAGEPRPRTCPKGKVKRRGRCVSKARKHHNKRAHKRAANTNRGGAK